MEEIKWLKRIIRSEIKDAREYIEHALQIKDTNPKGAELARELAEGELEHMARLHKEVECEIADWKQRTGQEPPPDMLARYNVLHEVATEDANEVRLMIQMYDLAT